MIGQPVDRRMDAEGLLGRRGPLVGAGSVIRQIGFLAAARGRARTHRVDGGVAGDREQPGRGRPPLTRRYPAAARQTLMNACWTTSSLRAWSPIRRATTVYTGLA